jgi:hypothetical protein
MSLGMERKGIDIQVVNTMPGILPAEPGERMRITKNGSTVFLTDIGQLAGAVDIKDQHEALNYVRFLTSLRTWHLWNGTTDGMVEVIRRDDAASLPTFGAGPFKPSDLPSIDGILGVLTRDEFRKGGFRTPVVARSAEAYVVTRWVFIRDHINQTRLDHIEETVHPDGTYHRKTLKSMPPPSLTGVQWLFPAYQ